VLRVPGAIAEPLQFVLRFCPELNPWPRFRFQNGGKLLDEAGILGFQRLHKCGSRQRRPEDGSGHVQGQGLGKIRFGDTQQEAHRGGWSLCQCLYLIQDSSDVGSTLDNLRETPVIVSNHEAFQAALAEVAA